MRQTRGVRCLQSIGSSVLRHNFPANWWRSAAAGAFCGWRSYGTSDGYGSYSVTLQEQIVNALTSGQRSKASSLLSELRQTSEGLRPNDFVSVLQCCARLPDPLFALQTWKFMEEKEIDTGGKCYFYTVRALCKGGYLKEAYNMLCLLKEGPATYPLLPACNNFLSFCTQVHTVNYANDCLDFMEHQMVGKNEITYSLLLKLAVLQQNLPAVHEIWNECIQYYRLNMISLRKFIWSFTELGDLDSAYETLQYMVDMAFRGNFVISRTAEGKLTDSRLDIPIPSKRDLSLQCFVKNNGIQPSVFDYPDRMDVNSSKNLYSSSFATDCYDFSEHSNSVPAECVNLSVMKLLRWSFGDVMHACAKNQNCALAEQLVSQMHNLGLELSSGTYDGFLRAVVASRGFHDGMKVLEVMQQKNLKPYDSTLAAVSASCSKALQLDLAEALLDQILKCSSPYPYNAFFEACHTLDRPERAIRMFSKMKKSNVPQDIRTYELLFSLFGNVNAPYEEGDELSQEDVERRVNAIEMDMMKNGIQHSQASIKNMLKAFGLEGMTKHLLRCLRNAENPLSGASYLLSTPVYNVVLHSLVQAREAGMAVETFKTMKSFGVPSDAATYTIMIDNCSIMKCYESARALLSMMIQDGYIPQTITYTSLIKTLLELEDFDEALKLVNQVKLDDVEVDLMLYNTVLQVASEKGKIDVVELIIEQMHQEKIQPDPSTCHFVSSAYLTQGFNNTAMEALQVLSMRMISVDDDIREEIRAEYETLVVTEAEESEEQIMELFEDSENSLPYALLQLRWCAMSGLELCWLPDESPWAKRLSHNYASLAIAQ